MLPLKLLLIHYLDWVTASGKLIWFKYVEIDTKYLPMFLSGMVELQEYPLAQIWRITFSKISEKS